MGYLRRLKNVFFSRRLGKELEEELQFHREMRLRKIQERGLSREEAETETARRMGNVTLAKEEMRDARVISWLVSCLQDIRHGVVLMRRDPGVTALVLLVLALGIGGNATIFTLFKAAFLDPLPYQESHRLVTVLDRFQKYGIDEANPTIPEFIDIRDRNQVFEHIAFFDHRDFQLTGTDEPVRVYAARATASLFPLLGVQAAQGRTFLPEENLPGRTSVVLLSDAYWRGSMAADPAVIGKTIRLNGAPCTVIGVLPAGFTFDHPTLGIPEPVEIYVPFVMDDYYTLRSGGHSNVRRVRVLARLRPGLDTRQADADLQGIASALVREHTPLYQTAQGEPSGFSFWAQPLQEAVVGRYRPLLSLLLGAVALLLLIACGNAAQLLLARSLRRGREVAVRVALGAGRARLIRLFLLESLVLAVCGGLLGLLVSVWMTQLLIALLPMRNSVFETAGTDSAVLLFTAGLSLASAVLFGIVPAVKGSELTPAAVLNVRGAAGGARWRHVMIAVQAAFSVVLLCAAGLLCQNLWTVLSAPRGFDPGNVAVMQLRLPHVREQALNPSPMRAYSEYLEKLAATAGLDSAAVVTGLPVHGAMQTRFRIEGALDDPGALDQQIAMWQRVSPDYFRVLRIPLHSGRTFREDDTAERPPVVIVNQEFVRRFLPDKDPLGQRIVSGGPLTIVGVVGDVRMAGLKTTPEPQVYVSYLQGYDPNIHLIVRSSLPPPLLLDRVKQAIREAYADQAVFNFMTLDEVLSRSVAAPRFQAFLIGAFALLALMMAASGLYGVISCLVTQRTSEIAIRIALGANRTGVARAILGQTAVWVLAGLAAGVGLGAAASTVVRRLSFSADPGEPLMYAVIVVVYLGVMLFACLAPVRRAARLDPSVALRCE